jgi:hypothetical protein
MVNFIIGTLDVAMTSPSVYLTFAYNFSSHGVLFDVIQTPEVVLRAKCY